MRSATMQAPRNYFSGQLAPLGNAAIFEFVAVLLFQLLAGSVNNIIGTAFTFAAIS